MREDVFEETTETLAEPFGVRCDLVYSAGMNIALVFPLRHGKCNFEMHYDTWATACDDLLCYLHTVTTGIPESALPALFAGCTTAEKAQALAEILLRYGIDITELVEELASDERTEVQ